MNVELNWVTPNAEEALIQIARVSSKRKDKKGDFAKLVKYLIDHKHWSPFEHASMSVEITTSKAIGIQLIRHRSFAFQEFSQRYQDVSLANVDLFEPIELRLQAEDNRQSSTEVVDSVYLNNKVDDLLLSIKNLYSELLEYGVSRETARFILPMATSTKIHMTGTLRSWIHFLDVRDDAHAQKEIQDIAQLIKAQFKRQFPVTSEALGY